MYSADVIFWVNDRGGRCGLIYTDLRMGVRVGLCMWCYPRGREHSLIHKSCNGNKGVYACVRVSKRDTAQWKGA
jgi:hypothetical protein